MCYLHSIESYDSTTSGLFSIQTATHLGPDVTRDIIISSNKTRYSKDLTVSNCTSWSEEFLKARDIRALVVSHAF